MKPCRRRPGIRPHPFGPPNTRVSYFWLKVGNRIITLIFNVLNNTTFTSVYSCYLLIRAGFAPSLRRMA